MSALSVMDPIQRGAAPAPEELPRLLAGIPARGPMSLEQHQELHGQAPLEGRRRRGGEPGLIDRVERAGLRGRGGGAFPMATKLRAVAGAGRRPVVVANGAEGEPASDKDRALLESLPHLVLDGGQLAARALGADELIVGLCDSSRAAADSVRVAIDERRALAGEVDTRLITVPDHYLAGHESALVNCINDNRAVPTFTPPAPYSEGVARRPTLVSNVETLAHLALIARHGSQWFRALGTVARPGSTLVTLSGPVAHPGVYEIESGASLASLIDAAGGATAGVRGVLMGGYGGSWIDARHLATLALSDEQLADHGAALGAGVVLVLSDRACPVAETARVARWLAGQSSRQCGPCVHGLDALATTLAGLAGGAAPADAQRRIAQLAALTRRRGACAHPDGAVTFILSAVRAFAGDFAEHARDGHCEACEQLPELPLPATINTYSSARSWAA